MECPPAKAMPAVAQAARPPSTICCATSAGSLLIGKPKIAIAIIGLPPIAKISLIALVAAIRPKSNGSSTIGIKKSVVLIMPTPLPMS